MAGLRVDYDELGLTYNRYRREDPRLAQRIHAGLADARTVINVGAGTGAYESSQSMWSAVGPEIEQRMVERLADGLASRRWDAHHGHLRKQTDYPGSLRGIVATPPEV